MKPNEILLKVKWLMDKGVQPSELVAAIYLLMNEQEVGEDKEQYQIRSRRDGMQMLKNSLIQLREYEYKRQGY